MPYSREIISSGHGRLEALRARHEALKERIREELKHPSINNFILQELKKEKLRIKEEKEQLEICQQA